MMNHRTALELERVSREAFSLALRVVKLSSRADACANIFTFAESCTGGLIASSAASIPGVSAVFPGGVVTYSNRAKTECLRVAPETIERHGAVSAQCAAEMAQGALKLFHTVIAVSVTGIAGPGGGSPEKPVGTVWFAVSHEGGRVSLKRGYYPRESRRAIQERAALTALEMLVRGLEYELKRPGGGLSGQV
jgi:PncC family amidohydrolase